jgi:prepilin-type N-terminal cleavage/methylation domain-containing protein
LTIESAALNFVRCRQLNLELFSFPEGVFGEGVVYLNNRSRHDGFRHEGFTLIELLVVIAIISILIALLIPSVQAVRESAAKTQCANNVKQLALAVHGFSDTHHHLPLAAGFQGESSWNGQKTSLFFQILPFLEQDPLYKSLPANGWGDVFFGQPGPMIFRCPSDFTIPQDPTTGLASYVSNCYVFGDIWANGAFQPIARLPQTFKDGTSNVVIFAERYGMCQGYPVYWSSGHEALWLGPPIFAENLRFDWGIEPINRLEQMFQINPSEAQCNPYATQTGHRAAMTVAMGDGSVRGVGLSISLATWVNAQLPNDGNPLGPDWYE